MGSYSVKEEERDLIKLIDKHNMEGFISKFNNKLIHSYDQQLLYVQYFAYYNFISYSMCKNHLYSLYYMLKKFPNVINDYFHYESDDLWLKNHKDICEKYCTSDYSHISLIYYITSEIKKTAVNKDDTNFYILLEILDLATDMPNVHYFTKKSRFSDPPEDFEYIVDHILFTLTLFNYNSHVYKKIIYKLLCIDRSLIFHSYFCENHTIVYTRNLEFLINCLYSLLNGYISIYMRTLMSVTVDTLHISNLIRDHLNNKENGNLIHLYDNKDERIYVHSENKLFDDNCLRWIYNTDDIDNTDNIGNKNGDILVKIILWISEIMGRDIALNVIDKTLTKINLENNKKSYFVNKEKNKSKKIWINMVKQLIIYKNSSDICSLIILISDNFLKF